MLLCFVTCYKYPALSPDDQLLAGYLSKRGIIVSPAIWDDPAVNWQKFDGIVLRSMWDYHTKIHEFNIWLNKLEQLGGKVLNPIEVIRWNQNKRYLVDLAAEGALVPPLQFCLKNSADTLASVMKTNGWNKAVVKPAVSGGAYNTWKTGDTETDDQRFAEMLLQGDVIVQKFMDEITTCGEISLMFFNKKFSHAVLKRAQQGDFRVQSEFGGSVEPVYPDETVLTAAGKLLNDIAEPLLYARVDGLVLNNNEFYLMELELIEPALFMRIDQNACENFYEALLTLRIKIN